MLFIDDIHKKFGDTDVLKGVSLSASKGDVISILGSSGSGKSTLLRCINLLEKPDKGRIIVDGCDIECNFSQAKKLSRQKQKQKQKQINAIRVQLGMVFQGFNLWSHMTVLGNVMEGPVKVLKRPEAQVKQEALSYLEKVGLVEKANNYPAELSGGQQQRVAIARALAMQPKVLLFDEPTSALDPELVNEVMLVIRALAEEERTMLIVTHEMNFARDVSDSIIFLHEGKIEEQTNPQDFFERPKSERVKEFVSHHR